MSVFEGVIFEEGDIRITVQRYAGIRPSSAQWQIHIRIKDWHRTVDVCRGGVVTFARALLRMAREK